MKKTNPHPSRCVFAVLGILCAVGAVCCGVWVYRHYAEITVQSNALETLAAAVESHRNEESETAPKDGDSTVSDNEEPTILPEYAALYQQNRDLIGWIRIPDTVVDYPVMQTLTGDDYYLDHNFQKEKSSIGVPYVQGNGDVEMDDNVIIHSHHIRGGQMFGALEQYKSQDFYETHRYIQFDTLTQRGTYEVLAVFKTAADDAAGLWCYDFTFTTSPAVYDAFVAKCKAQALYDTGVTAEYGDRLLTLSTCEYSRKNSRLLVVAKQIA